MLILSLTKEEPLILLGNLALYYQPENRAKVFLSRLQIGIEVAENQMLN